MKKTSTHGDMQIPWTDFILFLRFSLFFNFGSSRDTAWCHQTAREQHTPSLCVLSKHWTSFAFTSPRFGEVMVVKWDKQWTSTQEPWVLIIILIILIYPFSLFKVVICCCCNQFVSHTDPGPVAQKHHSAATHNAAIYDQIKDGYVFIGRTGQHLTQTNVSTHLSGSRRFKKRKLLNSFRKVVQLKHWRHKLKKNNTDGPVVHRENILNTV